MAKLVTIILTMCLCLKWPSSWASTASISAGLSCLSKVSKNTTRLLAPKPVKNALECADRRLPSITKKPLAVKPARCIRPCTRALSDSSSRGVNLLNSGMITFGAMAIKNNCQTTSTPQAHSHHHCPPACMSHSTTHKSGRPSTKPSTSPLAMSASHKAGVILLKPKRCSTPKVCMSDKGNPMSEPTSMKPSTSAICCAMPGPIQSSSTWLSASSPPSSVQPISTTASRAMSICDSRALARV